MTDYIKENFLEARECLNAFLANDDNFRLIESAGKLMVDSIKKGGKLISCGNGGSMSNAMHFAEELTGKFREERPSIPALSISDSSYLSCAANDYGYAKIFSRFVEGVGSKGDVLLAISTSGNSENILHAVETAKSKGMKIIGLSGKDGGKLKALCDVCILAPTSRYSDRIQEIHIKVIHSWIDYIERNV